MLSFKKAKVIEERGAEHGRIDLVVDIDGAPVPAIAYGALVGDVNEGDEVIVNTVAVDLGLGSGGNHFVLWNMARESVCVEGAGHIMKLRYTPLQLACLAVEEDASPHHAAISEALELGGIPVIVGTLHSQLAPAVAVLKHLKPDLKVAYVMTDGAALPIAISDTVAALKKNGLVEATITCGNAFGGDLEAVNVFTGLLAAKVVAKADVAVVTMGPGIVGTNTVLGFTGIEQGEIVNAVSALMGRPIAIPRISFKDERPRHRGLSMQTTAALGIAAHQPCVIALPVMESGKRREVLESIARSKLDAKHSIKTVGATVTAEALDAFKLEARSMGRGYEDDPEFFQAAGAAAVCAIELLEERL